MSKEKKHILYTLIVVLAVIIVGVLYQSSTKPDIEIYNEPIEIHVGAEKNDRS